ncbi:hypothetical protein [Pseudomonas typographi]|uniref:Uncharacterized protein n=1 Tax=Pseudomonas typographi TaxID=2715964 RepID=A0ABR7Z927_9PSED|nr:hypothetical protein [Pseudomonas typographi]MBD1601977.1 hypothetical protein [Pseudomonas typographi]
MTTYRIYVTADHIVRAYGDSIEFHDSGRLIVYAGHNLSAAFASYLYVLTGE